MVAKNEKLAPLPTMAEFCLNVPLYRSFDFDNSQVGALKAIKYFMGTIDCYCLLCKKHSVFQAENTEVDHRNNVIMADCLFPHIFKCTRNVEHQLLFIFKVTENKILKIGQFPSLADLATPDIQKYRKVLDKELYKDFSRAIGLAAHGIGIGSFTYLRRIFEKLIEEAHALATASNSWSEENYQKSRMDEKIALLKQWLPDFLVEQKILYSILSKGIHELSEQECLNFFPVIKVGIELILDEKIVQKERDAKIKNASKEIVDLHQKLKEK